MHMVVAGVCFALVAVVVVGVGPPAASALVVRERVVDFGQFDGDRCGDESSVELNLGLGPATVTSISPREPGTVFAERDFPARRIASTLSSANPSHARSIAASGAKQSGAAALKLRTKQPRSR